MLEELRLSNLITLQRGFDITKSEQIDGTIPVISSGGISSFHNKYKVGGPGVVIGRKGTLGKVFYCEDRYWPHDTSLWVKDFKGNDPKFIYYFLKLLHFERFDAGAANPTLNRNHIHSLKLTVPKKEFRSQIASILSAYDDLIENNNQRIKLLEEMAEEIYKEWFVRFRFPGYKDVAFLDKEGNQVAHGIKGAIPEGWEKKPLDEFESFSKSDSKLRKFKGEKRYLATADITDIRISSEGEIITWDNKPSRAQLKPELHSVFFARMSNTYKVLNFTESNSELIEELALTSGFLGLKAKNKACFAYLFSLIKGGNFHNYKDVYANGATQVSLTNEGFHMIRLIEPKIELIEKYGAIVNPFYDEINILMTKNKILQETRDLLLPRLISGKLSLEDLEM
jgi:type I restriction enzyme S subunit